MARSKSRFSLGSLIAGVPMIIFGYFMYHEALNELNYMKRLKLEGYTTQAIINAKKCGYIGSGDDRSHECWVWIYFKLDNGEWGNRRYFDYQIGTSFYNTLKVRDEIDVVYIPGQAKNFEVARILNGISLDQKYTSGMYFAFGLAGVGGLFLLNFLFKLFRSNGQKPKSRSRQLSQRNNPRGITFDKGSNKPSRLDSIPDRSKSYESITRSSSSAYKQRQEFDEQMERTEKSMDKYSKRASGDEYIRKPKID